MTEELLVVNDLKTWFPVRGGVLQKVTGHVRAVDGVSLKIAKGQVYGLVGESGSGKTTLGKSILRLIEPTSGTILFDGVDVTRCKSKTLRGLRARMQMIFQDPYLTLDPRQTVLSTLTEPARINKLTKSRKESRRIALELLEKVGLSRADLHKFPHEFSGGQRQRIAIARALAVNPEFIILDEPTSFLDVSVQAQILSLLNSLQRDMHLTYLLISHNISVVELMSQRIGVMYLGKIIEEADSRDLYASPEHPYTFHLMQAIPVPDPSSITPPQLLAGDPPSPRRIPEGCRFHPRCPYMTELCVNREPPLYRAARDRVVSCHYSIDFTKGTRNLREAVNG